MWRKHPLKRLKGEITVGLATWDGRRNRYVPVKGTDIQLADI